MEISFWAGEIIFTAVWFLVRIIIWIKNKKIDLKRESLLVLMYINLAVIIRFTFYPMQKINGRVQPLIFDAARVFPFRINVRPFVRLYDYAYKRDLWLNVIGNCALFIPSGIVIPIIYKKLDSFIKTVGVGFLLSLTIEILQLPFAVRASDVDDLIMNTAGVIVGYAIVAVIKWLAGCKVSEKTADSDAAA